MTICKKHDDALKIITKIDRWKVTDYEDAEDLLDDVKWELDNLYDLIVEAKEDGQKMEDRLREYKDAINGLGFERVKPKNQ